MSKQLETIFKALEKSKQVKIEAIMQETQNIVEQIYRDAADKAERDGKKQYEARINRIIENFKRQLAQRRRIWYKKYNEKRFALVNAVFNTISQRIQELDQHPNYKKIFQALIAENNKYLNTNYRIHVKPSDKEQLNDLELPGTYEVIPDLEETGIRLELPTRGITIENTLESRLRQQELELAVEIAAILFKRMEADPWVIPQVMDMLMRESTE